MAMSKDVLGLAIANRIIDADATDASKLDVQAFWKEIADMIISHIQDNATITVASGIKVSTTGTASAQKGATTTTGTATIL